MTAVVAAAGWYVVIVFAFGFLLGVARTLWLLPRVGARWAELIEMPLMLVVVYGAARWVGRRFGLGARSRPARLGTGIVALLLLLAAELGVVLRLRGLSLADYLEGRDPVSGSVYALSLLLFAAMPLLVTRGDGPG